MILWSSAENGVIRLIISSSVAIWIRPSPSSLEKWYSSLVRIEKCSPDWKKKAFSYMLRHYFMIFFPAQTSYVKGPVVHFETNVSWSFFLLSNDRKSSNIVSPGKWSWPGIQGKSHNLNKDFSLLRHLKVPFQQSHRSSNLSGSIFSTLRSFFEPFWSTLSSYFSEHS